MENITSRVKRAFIRHLGRLQANLRGGSVCVQGKVAGPVPGWVALKEKRPHCAPLGFEMLSISASSSKDKNDEEGASGRGWGSLGGNSSGKEGVISPQPEDKEPQTVRSLPRKSGDEFCLISRLPPSPSLSFLQGCKKRLSHSHSKAVFRDLVTKGRWTGQLCSVCWGWSVMGQAPLER